MTNTPLDELAGFLSGNAATSISPQNPLSQDADPSANPSNPNMNPSNPTAWANPSNPSLNPNLPGAVTNPSNPQYNPGMPGAVNNPSNYEYNPQMPGSMTNPASPKLNPNYPGSMMNPANPIHNPNFPVHQEIERPPGLSENASLPPAHAAWHEANDMQGLPPGWDPAKESWDQGPYWHLTNNPDFQIDPKLGPTDASTMGGSGMTPGALMFTNDPEHWLSVFHSHPEDEYDENERPEHPRAWAAEIRPQGQMGQTNQEGTGDWWPVNRGFGAEYYMPDSSKAQVHRVVPIQQMIQEQRQRDAENERYLVNYWNNKAGSLPPTHAASWRTADNYTQDTREWPDPTEPRASEPPEPHGCTCRNGTDSTAKLLCPIHGLDGQWEEAMDWSIPEGQPVGYPQDQPRGWVDAVHSSVSKLPPKSPLVKPSKFVTTLEQHIRAKRKYRWFRPKQGAISPETMQEWMNVSPYAPYLYHVTSRNAVSSIMKEGLHPHDNLGGESLGCPSCGHTVDPKEEGYWDMVDQPCPNCGDDYLTWRGGSQYSGDFFEPRSGHTYMGDFDMVSKHYYSPREGHQMVRIDMRKLDPSKINADEDAFWPHNYPPSDHPVVQKVIDEEPQPDPNGFLPNAPMTLGQWADLARLGDDPAETHHSLMRHGSIAYNGVVPPEAIERADPQTGESHPAYGGAYQQFQQQQAA